MTAEELREYTTKNRVEVILDCDGSYLCFINRKKGRGAWAISDNAYDCMVNGIKNYESNGKSIMKYEERKTND